MQSTVNPLNLHQCSLTNFSSLFLESIPLPEMEFKYHKICVQPVSEPLQESVWNGYYNHNIGYTRPHVRQINEFHN